MSSVGELEPDPNIIGHIAKPPFVQLPDPFRLLTKRAERLRSLAVGHELAAYLNFVAGLTDAQVAALPGLPEPDMPAADVRARAKEHAMPPLDRGAFKADAAFAAVLERIVAAVQPLEMPAAASEAFDRFKAKGAEAREDMIRNVLADSIPVEALAEHVFLIGALQVHFMRMAQRLDKDELVAVGDGACPACGAPPVASLIVGWPSAVGSRFCSCSLCGTLWNFIRARCTICGSTEKIGFQEVDGGGGLIKAETCESCHGYVKVLYQQRFPGLDPVADDVASLGLDLLVRDAGYRRGGINPVLARVLRRPMAVSDVPARRRLPSVDEVLRTHAALLEVERHGRALVVGAVRAALAEMRASRIEAASTEEAARAALSRLMAETAPRLKPVYNLTGTVLHTNLGRAQLAEAAIEAAQVAMRNAVALEFDLGGGRRGERDDIVRDLLCALTGAEDATVVNNNAAAVLLVLNTLSRGREAIVSRGELIEIGGAFRMPEIMSRAGAKLKEVGTTNRTHAKDYLGALGPRTGLILKVHTSNYRIEGFTKEVGGRELAALARAHNVPLVNDLGSGTLIDLSRFGMAHEPTVAEAVAEGADLVTFSGDKLLGGPQTGFIVGRKALIEKLNKNPMKRALRVDKIRLAALEATLRLYRDPDRLAETLPTYRMLGRPIEEMREVARRLVPALQAKLGVAFTVETTPCSSQVGSGAMPVETLPSLGLAIKPAGSRAGGRQLNAVAAALRDLPVPVVGRIENGALLLDLRCLLEPEAFVGNLATLTPPEAAHGLA